MLDEAVSFDEFLEEEGNDLVFLYESSKTPCPCTQNNVHGQYDRYWHQTNPAEPDCQGQGYFADVNQVNNKAFILPVDDVEEKTLPAGSYSKDDQIIYFSSSISLEGLVNVEYRGKVYELKNPDSYSIQNQDICQFGLLKLVKTHV